MAKIGLKGMQFYAFHGYYNFERRIGGEFVVDVIVDIDIGEDPNEKISNTYNYEDIYSTCQKYMKKRYQLLETLAHDIGNEIKGSASNINMVNIKIEKLNPRIGGKIDRAVVEMVF